MNKKTHLLTLFLLFTITGMIYAQHPDGEVFEKIENHFTTQSLIYPQEKLYLHIDKNYYLVGETIWFRVHATDAQSHIPYIASRYIYVELITSSDSVVSRVKIRPEHDVFAGHLEIDETLPEGNYNLRAYTRFMEDLGDTCFFRRPIRIGGLLSADYRIEKEYTYSDNQKRVTLHLHFLHKADNTSFVPENIEITPPQGDILSIRANKEGKAQFTCQAPSARENLSVYIRYDYKGKFHSECIQIPPAREDFDLAFFPEGGYMLEGKYNQVAFKALNSSGKSEEIQGKIVNSKGDSIASLQSLHQGMGRFLFMPHPEEQYYAICRNSKGIEKKIDLPQVTSSSATLASTWKKDLLYLQLNRGTTPHSRYYLTAHCRGRVFMNTVWDTEKDFIVMDQKDMPTGVLHFILTDPELNPVSERLVFNKNKQDIAEVDFVTNQSNYKQKEQIAARIRLTDSQQQILRGNVSVSVTDDNDVFPDSCLNILSTLLLTSDIKGYIEDPNYYFRNSDRHTDLYLDLLMMTQGWTRYNVSHILKGEFDYNKGVLEIGQQISGSVKGGILMTRTAQSYPVTLISLENNLFEKTSTDSTGNFHFINFELPENTRYMVQATTPKGRRRAEIHIEQEIFPKAKYIPFREESLTDHSMFDHFLKKADYKYITDNGMRHIFLDEVEITAARKVNNPNAIYSSPGFNHVVTEKQIERMRPTTILDIFSRTAGVQVRGNTVSIRGRGTPLFYVDGFEYTQEEVEMLVVQDIQEVEIVKDGAAAIFGTKGANGAILITTKTGEVRFEDREKFHIKTTTPLGYQVRKEFYAPKYGPTEDHASTKPDLRSTIHWAPHLETNEKGEIYLRFYSSDTPATYSVVIEGITEDGKVIHAIRKIRRTQSGE